MKTPTLINPTKPLNYKKESLLNALLNTKTKYFDSKEIYCVKLPGHDRSQQIALTHDLICRTSDRRSSRRYPHKRFEVWDKQSFIARGSYGNGYITSGTLVQVKDRLFFKPIIRFLKISQHENYNFDGEYADCKKTRCLAVKKPTYTDAKSYMCMKFINGQTLLDYLIQNPKLSVDTRIKLSLAILTAVENQVLANHLIHSDLHAKNIMVNITKDNEYLIHIIDYGRFPDSHIFDTVENTLSLIRSIGGSWPSSHKLLDSNHKTLINSIYKMKQSRDSLQHARKIFEQIHLERLHHSYHYQDPATTTRSDSSSIMSEDIYSASNSSNSSRFFHHNSFSSTFDTTIYSSGLSRSSK